MRVLMAGIVGILAWNLSITFIPRNPIPDQDTQENCAVDPMMEMTQQPSGIGVVSQIYNDGRALHVLVTSKWAGLDTQSKIFLYNSFICLAQKQNLPMQLMFSEKD